MTRIDLINVVQSTVGGLQVILQGGAQLMQNIPGLQLTPMQHFTIGLVGITISGICMALSQWAHGAALATPVPEPEMHEPGSLLPIKKS